MPRITKLNKHKIICLFNFVLTCLIIYYIFNNKSIPKKQLPENLAYFGRHSKGLLGGAFAHTTSSPRFPQSNGEAERAVRTVKSFPQKEGDPYLPLMAYRTTPLANGHSPAELLMGRKLCTTVPILPSCLNPGWTNITKLREREGKAREKQWKWFDNRHRAQDLTGLHPGDQVWITDMKTNGTISGRADTPRSYLVETPRGLLRRNRSHLIKLKGTKTEPTEQQIPLVFVLYDLFITFYVESAPGC
uniref:Integrase catalytic domain-containing protein n=1 Tax=Pundamilia nyererei TaxID=303518 RepID=A0A3B4F9Q1_9CICH